MTDKIKKDKEKTYNLEEVKKLMVLAMLRGKRHGEILFKEWLDEMINQF